MAVVLVCLFPLVWPLPRQSASPQTPPLRSTTELVKLDISVLDQSGKFVAGLTAHDFRVLDNGIEQPVAFFSPVQNPAQILVMLETSPAVYLIQSEHIAAAYALLDGLAADDQVALATYDATPHGILGFTEDKSALLAALSKVQYTIGMGDIELIQFNLDGSRLGRIVDGQKGLVLLGTGLDSSPSSNWDALVKKLRGHDVVIFPVALGSSLRGGPATSRRQRKKSREGMENTGPDPPGLAAPRFSPRPMQRCSRWHR